MSLKHPDSVGLCETRWINPQSFLCRFIPAAWRLWRNPPRVWLTERRSCREMTDLICKTSFQGNYRRKASGKSTEATWRDRRERGMNVQDIRRVQRSDWTLSTRLCVSCCHMSGKLLEVMQHATVALRCKTTAFRKTQRHLRHYNNISQNITFQKT